MAFKLTPPFDKNPTPIVNMPLEDGVLGRADKRGNILVNKDITDPDQVEDVVNHENVHIGQMKADELDYDEKSIIWKGKKYLRSQIDESNESLPWEKPAYKAG
jgi:hypothetical protein